MKKIFETTFGSHLYGTNTPTSDMDYKGIFIQDMDEIILGKNKTSIHLDKKISDGPRNTVGDIDIEYIELRKFIKDALDGQTYALDMLFANNDSIIINSDIYKYIVDNRDKILSKNVAPFIGYIRKQTAKYGLKGSRLGDLVKAIKTLENKPRKDKLYSIIDELKELCKTSDYIKIVIKEHTIGEKKIQEEYVKILEKMHPLNRFIGEVYDACSQYYKEYGARALDALQNNGVDWKAVSHAYRACYQLIELANSGFITFPFNKEVRDKIVLIKSGKLPYSVVQDELPTLMDVAITSIEQSTALNNKPDYDFWDNFLISTYRSIL